MKNKKNIIIITISILVIAIVITLGFKFTKVKIEEKNQKDLENRISYLFSNDVISAEDDVYSKQLETDEKIKNAMDSKQYTIDDPYILQNPYFISPLTAIIVFQTKESVDASIEINGKIFNFEKTKKHSIPVYGLVAGKENVVKVTSDGKTKEIKLDVKEIKDDLNLTISKPSSGKLSSGIYIVTTAVENGLYGFNELGELVWRLTEKFSLAVTELKNGHLLLSDSSYMGVSTSRKGIVEIDYLGKIYNVYDLEGGYHDDVIELDSGNLIVTTSKKNSETTNDYLIELNKDTGKIVKSWDLSEIADKVSKGFVDSLKNKSWGSINSVFYDKKTNSLILGMDGRNSIVSIGYDDKEINYIIGDPKFWNNDFSKYLLKVENNDYPLGAHTASINSDGNLVYFDNKFDASFNEDSVCTPYVNSHSSGKIYKIEGSSATLVNNFNDNNSFFSYAVSNYYEATNGNYIMLSAWEFPNDALNKPNCTMNQVTDGLHSTLYELDKDKNILFKANIPFGTFRVKKSDLYKDRNNNFNAAKIKHFNTLNEDIYSKVDIKEIETELKDAKKQKISLNITKNLLTIYASFQKSDEVYSLFINKEGEAYKYLVKSKENYLQPIVNLRNLKGTYAIFLVINGEYYNLDTTYKF
ncbi:MAG: aryl-sulfate sulfotransferase [Bacilli bacterium]